MVPTFPLPGLFLRPTMSDSGQQPRAEPMPSTARTRYRRQPHLNMRTCSAENRDTHVIRTSAAFLASSDGQHVIFFPHQGFGCWPLRRAKQRDTRTHTHRKILRSWKTVHISRLRTGVEKRPWFPSHPCPCIYSTQPPERRPINRSTSQLAYVLVTSYRNTLGVHYARVLAHSPCVYMPDRMIPGLRILPRSFLNVRHLNWSNSQLVYGNHLSNIPVYINACRTAAPFWGQITWN